MSIHKMTRAQLIAKIERDAQAVQRAAGLIADNARLQEKNRALQLELKTERAHQRSAVPSPCPDQKKEIQRLQSKLDKFAQCDMDEFEMWMRMRKVARGET